jgi:glycosyltransferase EpsD
VRKNAVLRAKFTQTDRDLICIYVGELSERKNQLFLLECVWRLRFDWIPIRLLLVGEGEMRAALEHEIEELELSDAVTLIGNAEPPTPYLAAADLYLSASRSEGLPFNIMEAMSLGLPIVASDVKGQRDLLRDTAARLIHVGDMESFCDAVKSYYENEALGVGSVSYPNIKKYRLSAVFAENLALLERCLYEERSD